VRALGGSSRERGSQNSSSGTTANATRHRNSMQYYEMHNAYNAYQTYNSNHVNNIMSEFCRISRMSVKTMSIIIVNLKFKNYPKSGGNVPGIMKFNDDNTK
jgi:hypothetical protein